jgi:leucyl-tRNA synthetase
MEKYDHKKIEAKWQKEWEKSGIYKTKEDTSKPKCYVLDMFPYPSGDGLHVGHPKGYIATDVYSRYKQMNGFNILHPMGWDAFGLPAENYAIKNKVHPRVAVEKNIKRFQEQLSLIGFNYDWSREINTTDPEYYKWTQWIFLKMLEKGLAYESKEPVNWCPSCQTVLANEDLEGGKCERCGSEVEKKPLRQWVLKITDYADRMLEDLEATDYVMPKLVDKVNPHRPGAPVVHRKVAHAIVFDSKTKKYLIIRNKKHGWDTVIIGGIEGDEDVVRTAIREVREETGYVDIEFKRILGGPTEAQYYTRHKGENRVAVAQAVYFELRSDKQVPRADDEDEDDEILWIDEGDFVPGKMVNSELPIWLERIKNSTSGVPKPLLDWPRSIKESQKNWIGRSEGAEIEFAIVGQEKKIKVFTTRADTLFGVTYVVLAPESPLVTELWPMIKNQDQVQNYLLATKNKTEIERTAEGKEKTGVILEGVMVTNPANGEQVPVWVADYVLAHYGTGAVMAVPMHDWRDWEFAKKFKLDKKVVEISKDSQILSSRPISNEQKIEIIIRGLLESGPNPNETNNFLVNSGEFDSLDSEEAREKITEKYGKKKVTYKLGDWFFSRQRYWGGPIPVIHCAACGVVPVPEKDLPVRLPEVENYEPTGTGESPLANIAEWVNVPCPKCGGVAKRETNTMPQWAGSSWYYLRYIDPKNNQALVDKEKDKYWSPVDFYIGGAEHATRHLIYARFWHKFLFDIGVVNYPEPFTRLQNVGLIMAEDGRKMSKRYGNVINPDDVVANYGADTLRVYEMFMGPFDQAIAWSTESMIGPRRFLEKVWKIASKIAGPDFERSASGNSKSKPQFSSLLATTIKKVGEDIEAMRFNTAISSMMILVNEMEKEKEIGREDFEVLLRLLSPFAPHITEELWQAIGNKGSIHESPWPKYETGELEKKERIIIVQVNGVKRDELNLEAEISPIELEKMAINSPKIAKWLEGKKVKKVVQVKGRLVNIVV